MLLEMGERVIFIWEKKLGGVRVCQAPSPSLVPLVLLGWCWIYTQRDGETRNTGQEGSRAKSARTQALQQETSSGTNEIPAGPGLGLPELSGSAGIARRQGWAAPWGYGERREHPTARWGAG